MNVAKRLIEDQIWGGGSAFRIAGGNDVGDVLSVVMSSGWTATAYQWTRDGVDISGATGPTYALVTADSLTFISCRVRCFNPAVGASVSDAAQFRVVSSGLRLAIASQASSPNRHHVSRLKRKALVEYSGVISLIFPTFTIEKPSFTLIEIDFPEPFRFQCGIELNYLQAGAGIAASTKIVSAVATYNPASPDLGYVKIDIDLGSNVIPAGQFFGIWTAIENTAALASWKMPLGNIANSKVPSNLLYELAFSRTDGQGGSFIDSNYIATVNSITANNTNQNCYAPCAILANSTVDAWCVAGDSIPEGNYDVNYDNRGDANGHFGYADKLFATRLGLPCLNLSKGSDRIQYVVATDTSVTPNRSTYARRKSILELCSPNKIHTNLGTNDIAGGSNISSIRINSATFAGILRSAVPTAKLWGGTITPSSTSTDSWLTVANQTAAANRAGAGSIRGLWNADLRTKSVNCPYDSFIELANTVENDTVAQDSKWVADGVTPLLYVFNDGVHPNFNGSLKIATDATIGTPA